MFILFSSLEEGTTGSFLYLTFNSFVLFDFLGPSSTFELGANSVIKLRGRLSCPVLEVLYKCIYILCSSFASLILSSEVSKFYS